MKTYQDLLTRAGWTALQAGLAILATYATGIPAWWALPLATVLSAVKTWVVGQTTKTPPPAAGGTGA